MDIDSDLLLLLAAAVLVTWLLVTIWRYVSIQSRKGLLEQEKTVFGHGLHPESRAFMATVVPRFGSPWGFLVAIAVIAILGLARVLDYLQLTLEMKGATCNTPARRDWASGLPCSIPLLHSCQ